jgi:hypothetical protein
VGDYGKALQAGFIGMVVLIVAGFVGCGVMGVGWYMDRNSEDPMAACTTTCDPEFKGRAAARLVAQMVGDECLCVQEDGDLRPVPAS